MSGTNPFPEEAYAFAQDAIEIKDPRMKKTKLQIRKALCELLEEKSLEQITVSELTQRAAINRSTFYLHYANIAEVFVEMETHLFSLYDESLERYQASLKPEKASAPKGAKASFDIYEATYELFLDTFNFIQDNEAFAPLVVNGGQENRLLTMILRTGHELFSHSLLYNGQDPNSWQMNYYIHFVVNGLVQVIKEWLAGGMKESTTDMARLANSLIQVPTPLT
jgi:AcrR family transcriptional regulator